MKAAERGPKDLGENLADAVVEQEVGSQAAEVTGNGNISAC